MLNPIVQCSGIIGFSVLTLLGNSNGTYGMMGRRATIVSSSGLILRVSFQPNSLGSGGMMMPSHVTRLITCTFHRCQWIGCVSTPLCVIFQICVPSLFDWMGVTLMSPLGRFVASMSSVEGFTNG